MPRTPKLSGSAVKRIDALVDGLFDRLKFKVTGPGSVGRHLFLTFDRDFSLAGLYEQAVAEEGGYPDHDVVNKLTSITADYLDQHRSKAKAQIKKRLEDLLRELGLGRRDPIDFKAELADELDKIKGDVTAGVSRVVQTETQRAQTVGLLDAIGQVNDSLGIDDPVVFWVTARDADVCEECRRLHVLPDGVTPRVWKASEVKAGYHKKGDAEPSWSLLHPHCRCALTSLLPGWGFAKSGNLTFKGNGHDEWQAQRSG